MTIDPYQRRDSTRAREPAGKAGTEVRRVIFVVQKHAARQLHYDFRLEMDGVLKSWAVPKGPSLDPAAKRLAVQVEDHSLEYAGFEGTIPEGAYGAGTVMVWDLGSWQPSGDAKDGYAKGSMRFILFGKKLRGSWALVRMKSRPGMEQGRENWLLIKERDAEARTGREGEVVERMPDSALTGRTMEEIAAAGD